MASYPKITIPSTQWVSVNTLTGVPVGTAMELTITSTYPVQLWEGTQPAVDFRGGKPTTNMSKPYASPEITEGSDEIWAICVGEGFSASMAVVA